MPGIGEIITESQIWKSVFRHPMPVDRRNRIVVMLTNFFLHLHPVSIKKQGIALSYTWCMGGVTFFLFLVETVTGVLLMFYYRPTLEWAYNDILALRDIYSLGIMREIHRWGAHAMVITVWLHMYRVFLTGSYKPPREFNWVVGVILLLLTLLLCSPAICCRGINWRCGRSRSARTWPVRRRCSGTKDRGISCSPWTAWR
jgi:quinol-cytochrome oxidoreductase complex cytochrome b subunit